MDREHGRFRSYLLGAVKHFLSHQREAALRQKRGGDLLLHQGAEARFEPVDLGFERVEVHAE